MEFNTWYYSEYQKCFLFTSSIPSIKDYYYHGWGIPINGVLKYWCDMIEPSRRIKQPGHNEKIFQKNPDLSKQDKRKMITTLLNI